MAEAPELVYDDLALGRRFPEFRYEITPALVRAFVAATGDDNPVYNGRAMIELEIAGPEGTSVRGGATAPVVPLPGLPGGKGDPP